MAVRLEQMLQAAAPVADLPTIERGSTLTEQVYDRLRHGLLVGMWDPGEKITARRICKDLGVSLTPAREAMVRLANEGALDVALNRTFSAATLTLAEYREIARIRIALEPIAAESAAPRIDKAQLQQLEKVNEALAAAIREERFRDALLLDSEFHLTLYRASDQPTLMGIIDRLWLRTGPTRNRLSHNYRRTLAGYENHRAVIAALRAQDAVQARAVITRDLEDGTRRIIAHFETGE